LALVKVSALDVPILLLKQKPARLKRKHPRRAEYRKVPEKGRAEAWRHAGSTSSVWWRESRLCVRLRYVKPIVEEREPIVLNQIVVAPELSQIVAPIVQARNEHLTMHLVYVKTIGIDCQPIINVVGIGAAPATVEGR
jgi:hypothetical protein